VILWCGTNTDVTEQRDAAAKQRQFLKEMLAGFTEGRLRLCFADSELPAPLPPLSDAIDLTPTSLRLLRKQLEAVAEGLKTAERAAFGLPDRSPRGGDERGSARRRGCGTHSRGPRQWDDPGLGFGRRTWDRGGHDPPRRGTGFHHGRVRPGLLFMQSCTDRLYLLSVAGEGTTVVLEIDRDRSMPAWLDTSGDL
jgi:hypothetical protein